MNKLFTKIASLSVGLALAIGVGVAVSGKEVKQVKADEAVSYDLDLSNANALSSRTPTGNYSYTTVYTLTMTSGSRVFTAYGFNPNNYSVAGTRFGNKNTGTTMTNLTNGPTTGSNYVQYISTNAVISDSITKVEITTLADFGTCTKGTGYVQVSANSNFSSSTNYSFTHAASSTIPVTITSPAANRYYRIVWQKESSSSNAGIIVSHIKFYYESTPAVTYTVTYSAGTHGSGTYSHTSQPEGDYELLAFSKLTGVSASSGYRFKNYTVGGVNKNPGEKITLDAAKTVTVNFEEKPPEDVISSSNIPSAAIGTGTGWGTASTLTDYTDAVYTVRSMAVSTGYCLKFNDSTNGYIYTSTVPSGLRLKSVTIESMTASKTVGVYAKTGAYTAAPSDKSTALGTITSSSLTYTFAEDSNYNAICLRGHTSATDIGAVTILYEALIELSSVTSSGQTTSFTAGTKFEYGGTLTAHYTGGKADTTVTPASFKYGASGINPTTAGTTITTNDTLSVNTHNGKYIYVVYTEDTITKWASYQITVNYAPVTSVVIDTHAAEIGKNETYNYNLVGVTVNTEYAQQGYEWVVSGNTVDDDYFFDASGLLSGDTEGTITLRCRSTADNSKYDELIVSVTGEPTADFVKESTSGYEGKSEIISFTYGNISDTSLIEITSNNTSYVTVENDMVADEGEGLVTINFVGVGSTTVSISYDGGSTLDTLSVTVNADAITSISVKTNPTKTTYVVGETFSSAGLAISATKASGDSIDLSSNEYNLRNAPTVLNERGVKTITVELIADTSITTSFSITVNMPSGLKIATKVSNNDGGYVASLLTSANTLSAGMKIAIGSSTKEDLMAAYTTGNNVKPLSGDGITITYDSENYEYTFIGKGADAAVYTLGGDSTDGWTFTDVNGNRLYKPTGSNNYMKANDGSTNILWDISLDAYGVATITNKGNTTNNLMARNKTSDLYSCYASTSTAIVDIELYLITEEIEPTYSYDAIDLSGTIYDFIRAVYNNPNYYTCVNSGEGSTLTNWSSITSDSTYIALTQTDKDNLACAVIRSPDGTKQSSEMVANFLEQYDYIIGKYGKSYDYLGRVDAGTATVRNSTYLLISTLLGNSSTIITIIAISAISLAAVGGYFLFRKKKED